jgi:transcriptional regulator with PAS, ATPase and Fis domain
MSETTRFRRDLYYRLKRVSDYLARHSVNARKTFPLLTETSSNVFSRQCVKPVEPLSKYK